MQEGKEKIVISAINIFEGGALSILNECLESLNQIFALEYDIVVLVHDKKLVDISTITVIEYPKSRSSYVFRFYYEYFYFKKIAKQLKPCLWFSLHDMTPNVKAKVRAVYCHNPSPFYKSRFQDWKYSPTIVLFSYFYKFIYGINIKQNSFVITQQEWMAKAFTHMFNIPEEKLIVSQPRSLEKLEQTEHLNLTEDQQDYYSFFYPAFPRVFKNFEVIGEAVRILNEKSDKPFKVFLTIDGSENKYAKKIVDKYKDLSQIEFIGLVDRSNVELYYEKVDAMLFPSRLETWGLPVSEFTPYNKPILVADLPYAHETGAQAKKISFFPPNDPEALALKMEMLLYHDMSLFNAGVTSKSEFKSTSSWKDLFTLLLKQSQHV